MINTELWRPSVGILHFYCPAYPVDKPATWAKKSDMYKWNNDNNEANISTCSWQAVSHALE